MDLSIEHIGLPAKDSAALAGWYQRVLGAKHLWDNGQNPPSSLLSLGAAWVEIYPATGSRPETADNKLAGFRHLALRVPSLDAAKAELEGRGVKFTDEPRPAAGGGRVLFFEDGEGNLLHLVERTGFLATDGQIKMRVSVPAIDTFCDSGERIIESRARCVSPVRPNILSKQKLTGGTPVPLPAYDFNCTGL
jgi:catechol 2,3-dioxygenase-like lactoylglutathione lyase family enzyme